MQTPTDCTASLICKADHHTIDCPWLNSGWGRIDPLEEDAGEGN